MSDFDEIIRVGIDKYGQADFRIGMQIATLNQPRYKQLIEMMSWATAEAVSLWTTHSKHNPDRHCAASITDGAPLGRIDPG